MPTRARLSVSAALASTLLAASPALANSDAKFRKIAETEYHWRKLQEGPDQDFVMVGFVFFGDEARGGKFVEAGFLESDGEGFDGLWGLERHRCDDRA